MRCQSRKCQKFACRPADVDNLETRTGKDNTIVTLNNPSSSKLKGRC